MRHSVSAPAGGRQSAGARFAVALGLLFGLALLAGLGARWQILDGRPLAVDEYYMAQSVGFIFSHGVPQFPAGGYYDRALPLQYLMAGSVVLFGDHEFSLRLPSFVFSLAAIALAWLYARRFTSWPGALALVIALLVSSWHIEYAGFGRMYAMFQAAVLAFLLALDDAFFTGAWQRRYLPHLALVGAALVHDIATLLSPLLFLPLIAGGPPGGWRGVGERLRFAVVGLVSAVLCLGYSRVSFRNLGVTTPNLPPDYQHTAAGSGLNPPAFPFWELSGDPWTSLALLGSLLAIVMAVLALVWRRRGAGALPPAVDLWLAALVLASLAHLVVPMALILGLLVLRYDLLRAAAHPRWRRLVLALALLITAGWLAYALSGPAALGGPEIDRKWDLSRYAFLKGLWTTFFGWPDLLRTTLLPFASEMPLIGLFAAMALATLLVLDRQRPLAELLRQPWLVVVYTILVFGLFEVPWVELRYWFHLQPVVLLLILMALERLARRLAPGARTDGPAALAFLALFALGSDFNPSHLIRPTDPDVAYRQGAFTGFQAPWYPRLDFSSPAAFVNAAAGPDEPVVVEYHFTSGYYLDTDYAVYLPRQTLLFAQHSQREGTLHRWSGRPLLRSPEALQAYVRDARTVWLIRDVRRQERFPQLPELDGAFGPRLRAAERVHLSEDGRIEVLRVELAPPESSGAS